MTKLVGYYLPRPAEAAETRATRVMREKRILSDWDWIELEVSDRKLGD